MTQEDEEREFRRRLEELKKDWDSIKTEPRSREELKRMMYASRLSRLIRRPARENIVFAGKALISLGGIIAVDYFMTTTPYITAWLIFLLIDDYFGFRYLRFIPLRDSVRETLEVSLVTMKRLRFVYVLTPLVIWMVLRLIMSWLPNGEHAGATAMALLPVLFLVCLWIWIKWSAKIGEVAENLRSFDELEASNS